MDGWINQSINQWLDLFQVNDAEVERIESEAEHQRTAFLFNAAEQKVKQLQRQLRRNINKSKWVVNVNKTVLFWIHFNIYVSRLWFLLLFVCMEIKIPFSNNYCYLWRSKKPIEGLTIKLSHQQAILRLESLFHYLVIEPTWACCTVGSYAPLSVCLSVRMDLTKTRQ